MATPSNSSASSNADAAALTADGLQLAAANSGLIVETAFASVYGVIFTLAVYSICRKGLKSRRSIVMLCVVVCLYASALGQWAINVATLFRFLYSLFAVDPASKGSTREPASAFPLMYGQQGLYMFNMLLGDSVVLWRALVLFQQPRVAVLIPCFMLFMSLVFTLFFLVPFILGHDQIFGSELLFSNCQFIAWMFSLGTNASCTILIGIRAWQYRQMMRTLYATRKLATERIMSLLVESGFIYCLFWLTQLVIFNKFPFSPAASYAFDVFSSLGDQVSGMYPTLIIVIVNFQRTIWDEEASSLNTNKTTINIRPRGTTSALSELRCAVPSDTFGATTDFSSVPFKSRPDDGKESFEMT
ncbi:hypothetical protein C8R44DRAFT_818014 [Mycena epipterygia]|nr:hypothetical protein C8R44DRAFT_818014 [Mycena epipterygia]